MWGPGGVIIIWLALGAALALFLVIVFGRLGAFRGVARFVTRSIWCPILGRNVTAEFQEQAWGGRPLDVTWCSAFSPSTAITCEKLCLHLKKLPSAKPKSRAA